MRICMELVIAHQASTLAVFYVIPALCAFWLRTVGNTQSLSESMT